MTVTSRTAANTIPARRSSIDASSTWRNWTGAGRVSTAAAERSAHAIDEELPAFERFRLRLGLHLEPAGPARVERRDGQRSEERRVGKECRSRGSPDH